ncbi:MAG: glycosyltransferase, partial [Solirubrobacteraceae bacterium]|nr:glycosyltransferase [Solirubrobacteraceae bacterium]
MSDDAQPGSPSAPAEPMSDATESERATQHALAKAQQALLERDLRLADLSREAEELRASNVELELKLEAADPWRPRHLASAAKQRAKALLKPAESPRPFPGVALAGLPVTLDSATPQWTLREWVDGQTHAAVRVDPPSGFSWGLDLAPGAEVTGFVALRPAAWDKNSGGLDLIVELHDPAGTLVTSFAMAVDPAGLEAHRRWLPWRVALPATGPHRLTLRTEVASGAAPDYAWGVIGDPRLETPALRARSIPRADGERSGKLLGSIRDARPGRGGAAPSVSLLMPVHDPDPGLLDRTIAAVFGQTDRDWQLCIVDDGSSDPAVRDRLARASQDRRVTLARHEAAKGISGATNAALGIATGEFVATLDHDDVLAPDAIAQVKAYLARHPETDLVYSDNDLLAGNRRFSAALKPDWSPELLRSVMYTLHFSAYRRSVIEALGGWRSVFDGAQDHDLVLRLSESTDRIGHLPRVLYHWRAHAGSAALGELAKPLAYERGVRAIEEHLERTGHDDATVTRHPGGRYRVRYPRTAPVTVFAGLPADEATDGPVASDATRSVREPAAAILAALRPDDRLVLAATEAGAPLAEAAAEALADD